MKILVFLCSLISLTSLADFYGFHPKSRFYLGGGLDKFQPNKAFLDCVDYEPLEPLDGKPVLNTTFEISGVQSARDFQKKIGFSSFLEGSYLFMQGDASLNYSYDETFNEKSLTWLVLLKADYGPRRLKGLKLKSEFQDLDKDELVRRCGREVIVEERRSVMLYLLLSLKNLSHTQKENLSAKLSFLAKGVVSNGKFSADYQKFVEEAFSLGQVSIKIFSQGNFSLDPLNKLLGVELMTDHNNLLGLFKDYMEGVDAKASMASSYQSADIGILAKESFEQPFFKKKILLKLYSLYQSLESSLRRVKKYFEKGYMRPDLHEEIAKEINFKLDALEMKAKACFNLHEQESCQNKGLEAYEFSIGHIRNRVCKHMRDQALSEGLVEKSTFAMYERHNFVPYQNPEQPDKREINWGPCEELSL